MNIKFNIFIISLFICLIGIVIFSPFVFARQTTASTSTSLIWKGVTCNQPGKGPCVFCDMVQVISNMVNFLTQLAYVIAAAAIVGGGVMILISAGNETKFKQGKSLITNAVIGIVITSTAWIIVNTIFHVMTGDGNFIWSSIIC